jgi:hypothetical protein
VIDDNESEQKLQRLVQDSLRSLPLRRAPASLEGRVMQELARLAALPWWRRSFAHWPVAVRSVFLALCVVLSALTLMGSARMGALLAPLRSLGNSLTWLRSAVDALGSLAHAIPPLWLYEGLAIAALLYGFLIALGTAAYRTLYLDA